jgi:hypothetical protein
MHDPTFSMPDLCIGWRGFISNNAFGPVLLMLVRVLRTGAQPDKRLPC